MGHVGGVELLPTGGLGRVERFALQLDMAAQHAADDIVRRTVYWFSPDVFIPLLGVWEMVIDWLAAGVDPANATIFIQSRVPEHAELHTLLSMIT